MQKTVGLISPGAMGSTVGEAAVLGGAKVIWVSTGRSPASVKRAEAAGLHAVSDMAALVAASDVIISICPPHAAVDVAKEVAALRFGGLYLDANAVSPATAAEVAGIVIANGAKFVDGSIIGGPPQARGTTRLFLSGAQSVMVYEVLKDGHFDIVRLGEAIGGASALKMVYSGWTKGSAALLLATRALARAQGVEDALLTEWDLSLPGVRAASVRTVANNPPKAWRFSAEMEEIAATFAASDLPDGFHLAAAEVYRRLAEFKNESEPSIDEVLVRLLRE